ncbi:MAG: carbon-nitrogen hydrolase family protein [Candidatus Kapaibacterium sp.]
MRKIRIASVSFLMEDTPHTVEFNLSRSGEYIRDASAAGAQIVCLPETVTTNGVPSHPEVDQEWTTYFSEAARTNSIAVIAPFYSKDGDRIFNQATVFTATGEEIGHYRKAQPTGLETKSITPGSEFPIIDLGFARIAIMICMDIYFPEIARIYAMKGAELLFWPTTTHGPTQSGLLAQLQSRTIDNSLYIVESNLVGHAPYAPYEGRFYPGNARIVDFNGDIIAQTGRRAGLAICDIDLDERRQTSNVVLIHDPDDTRADLEALARMDLYANEFAEIAKNQKRYYDTIAK